MKINSVSLIIPAFNEADYIGPTLDSIFHSIDALNESKNLRLEVIVVDNGSTDLTADIARSKGARVVSAEQRNVAFARNAGANAATGKLFIFIDADVFWPPEVFSRIIETMKSERCVGGAVDTAYRPHKTLISVYLRFWKVLGKLFQMAQGATQFCTAEAFFTIGRFDENVYMGEDVKFYAQLRGFAKSTNCYVEMIEDVQVTPSCRKFDRWPIWKTLMLTNPLTCLVFSRKKKPWGDWYSKPTR